MAPTSLDAYQIGIITALSVEQAAMEGMLDEEYEILEEKDANDDNVYSVGRIHRHHVVIASLPAGIDGLTDAATVAKDMMRTFKNLRLGLLVGVGGGIPDLERGRDIRLGDVVVSQPEGTSGGVIQYDKGKLKTDGHWQRKGSLNAPPKALLMALRSLQAKHERKDSNVPKYLRQMFETWPKMSTSGYQTPGREKDTLYKPRTDSNSEKVVVQRPIRGTEDPVIHYGTIVSGNQVVKDALFRDKLRDEHGAICTEMEAAGLMNNFPCLVIRGVCDYADEFKKDEWHRYAAATAAAFAKELLEYVSVQAVAQEASLQQQLVNLNKGLAEQVRGQNEQHKKQNAFNIRQENRYLNEQHRDCHRMFGVSDYERQKNINIEAVPGTCKWLLNHPKYVHWLVTSGTDLLWVSADPGCGKTVLSKSLVDRWLPPLRNDADERPIICYFFFKDNEEQNNLATALCAVLHQIFSQQRQLIVHAFRAFEANRAEVLTNKPDELWRILLSVTNDSDARPVICVLDALDECRDTDCRLLIDNLVQFHEQNQSGATGYCKLKWLVTSRPYDDIRRFFAKVSPELPAIHLQGEIENDQIQGEIDLVIDKHVGDLSGQLRLSEQKTTEVMELLKGMGNRTYLWLHLVIDDIKKTLEAEILQDQAELSALPSSVDEAYEKILGHINSDKEKQNARMILMLVIGARRPLTVEETALALGVARTTPRVPQTLADSKFEDIALGLGDRIRRWCGLFVFIRNERLYLIHQTAKEFLLARSEQRKHECNIWKGSLGTQDVEAFMARICIAFLCLADFNTSRYDVGSRRNRDGSIAAVAVISDSDHDGAENRDNDVDNQSQYGRGVKSFFVFASVHWADYVQAVEAELSDDFQLMIQQLYDTESARFYHWTRVLHRADIVRFDYGGHFTMENVHFSAFKGHTLALQRLLTLEPGKIDSLDRVGRSVLALAAGAGHLETVNMLLDQGAIIDAQETSMSASAGNALYAASFSGHTKVMQTLLHRGADIHAKSGLFGSPLAAAAARHHTDAVRVLLAYDAAMSAQEERKDYDPPNSISKQKAHNQGRALYLALNRGYSEMVQVLLEECSNTKTDGSHYNYALAEASHRGRVEVVRTLLGKGANVNARHWERNLTALESASSEGHLEVVRTLLDGGADVNVRHSKRHTALQEAARGGFVEVVKLLLDRGADVNAQCGRVFRNPLLSALSPRLYDQFHRKLKGDAGVDDHDDIHLIERRPILPENYVNVVSVLLDHGADVNSTDGLALLEATLRGSLEVVRVLLEKGADINRMSDKGESALYAASERGSKDMVQMLLDNGADVNAESGFYGGALQAASARLRLDVAQMLIDHGADVNAQVGACGNALQAASGPSFASKGGSVLTGGEGYVDVAQIEAQLRARGGYTEMVQKLLGHGAKVNAEGGIYGTALQAASAKGFTKVVEMLLKNGADVEVVGGRYGTSLSAASLGGFQDTVQILLNNGARVEAQGGAYNNALQAAASADSDESLGIVRALLDRGAHVNVQGGQYGNALQAASRSAKQSLEKVTLLLDRGAQINQQGGSYGSALQAAATQDCLEVVQLLLNKGAEVNAQGGVYGNALLASIIGNGRSERVVKLLVDAGADINFRHAQHGTALEAALRHCNTGAAAMLKKIMAKGQTVTAQEGQMETDEAGQRESAMSNQG